MRVCALLLFPRPQGVSSAAEEVCYGVSWDVNGVTASQATMRPVYEFPLAHPAATSSTAKMCMGYGASTAPQQLAIPASGKTVDAATAGFTRWWRRPRAETHHAHR